MRNVIQQYATDQKAMIQKAKEGARGLFSGIDAKDMLFDPDNFVQFIREKAFARFSKTALREATRLGHKLAFDLVTEANKGTKLVVEKRD